MAHCDTELKSHFEKSRILGGYKHTFLTLLYSPLGIILSIVRLFMLFHIYILSFVFPTNVPVCRAVLRFMLLLCGLSLRVRDEENRRDTCPVIISNYLSVVDRLIFSLVQPNIMANEWGLPPLLSWLFGIRDLNEENSRDTFLQNARFLCQETTVPLFTRPEGSATSGKHALLKFSTWQFSISDSVQPVVMEARRPMPMALTTLGSTTMSDIFWFLFSPYTLFTVRYLPVVNKEVDETAEVYSERVREKMAAALSISCSLYSRHDKNDLVKKLVYNSGQLDPVNAPPDARNSAMTRPSRSTSQPLSPNLEAMVQHCKEVVPQVPLDVLRAEIARTQDASGTLSSIFEGNIEYEPETEMPVVIKPSPATSSLPSALSADFPRPGGSQTYAADVFAKKSDQRELSLAERKHAMLTEARLRYIRTHNLSITLEQIESGRL